MKRANYLQLLGLMCGVGLLLGGCLLKPARVPTRQFILAPIPPPEHAPAAAPPLSVEVGFVKMPSYLLRDSMAFRKSATELEYLETALWAERLDQAFRQTLAENLSRLLASDQALSSTSERNEAKVRISVNVERFDVDTQGQGTLLAEWRLTAADTGKVLKSGQTRLNRTGPSPRANPQVIATTLSDLMTQFSQDLAEAIRESAKARP